MLICRRFFFRIMLQLKRIHTEKQEVADLLMVKGFDASSLVEKIIETDKQRKAAQAENDQITAELKNISRQIGQLMKEGKQNEVEEVKLKTAHLKEQTRKLAENQTRLEKEINELLVQLPNVPHISVPKGKKAEDNPVIRASESKVDLPDSALPHWDLAKKHRIIDFELGTKITGAGFPVYQAKGAKLQRALVNFFLDEALNAGYREVIPPYMVNAVSAFGTGQLPDKEGQMYQLKEDDYFLIPTAEVPVTNIYRDTIIDADDLPLKLTAYTPCFRREAGSYGKDVRGLNRIHQFDKVEIVHIEHPEKSYPALEGMTAYVESLLQKLNLPYRIVLLCGGEMSFASAKTFDFEVFSAAQKRWLEVSSVTNFEDFQANRLKLRFREAREKKTRFVHTLNGSALALPRIMAAILEN